MSLFFKTAFRKQTIRSSLQIALVIGTVLNAINQGYAFWMGQEISWIKFMFNYFVPYSVATYGAVKNELGMVSK